MQKKIIDKSTITIITVNFNTAVFIEFMLSALEDITHNPYKIIICDNGSASSDILRLRSASAGRDNVSLYFRYQSEGGSVGHGEALDFLVKKVVTDYFVILDADACFLINDWDKLLISRLTDKVKCIGTQPAGGKVNDFPGVYGVLFETKAFMDLGANFSPETGASFDPHHDTGWSIRGKYLAAGFCGEILKIRNTRDWKRGAFKSLICAEFYMKGVPEIFISHFGRGSSLGAAKRKGFWTKIPILRRYVAKILGFRERSQWIRTAREIISAQR